MSGRTRGGTAVRRSAGGDRGGDVAPDAGTAFPTLPPIDAAANVPDDPNQDQAGGRLAELRAALAEAEDAAQRSRLGTGAGNTPSDDQNIANPDHLDLPPALRTALAAEGIAQASQVATNRRAVAESTRFSPLGSRGAATEPNAEATVDTGSAQYVCPNCGRVREYQMRYAGSIVPCQCGTNILVPYPSELRGMIPGPATTEEVKAAAAGAPAPVDQGGAATASESREDTPEDDRGE